MDFTLSFFSENKFSERCFFETMFSLEGHFLPNFGAFKVCIPTWYFRSRKKNMTETFKICSGITDLLFLVTIRRAHFLEENLFCHFLRFDLDVSWPNLAKIVQNGGLNRSEGIISF